MRTSEGFKERIIESKTWNKEGILQILNNPVSAVDKQIVCRMLIALYNKQTADEKVTQSTGYNNGQGFTAYDAPFLSSVAEGAKKYGRLTEKQMGIVCKKLVKYAGQLERIAKENQEAKKLVNA